MYKIEVILCYSPKMCPKKRHLSPISFTFPRECLHFSGEIKTVLTGEKVHLGPELGSHRVIVGADMHLLWVSAK